MHVNVSCKKNYTKKPEAPWSSTDVPDKKTRTSSGGFNFRKDCFYCGYAIMKRNKKTCKSCNVSCKNREVDKAVHQAIIDRGGDEWTTEVKCRFAFVHDLGAEGAVYHKQCSSNFHNGKGNLEKNVTSKERGRLTTADEEAVFLEIVEHIGCNLDEQLSTGLAKMMEEKLSVKNVRVHLTITRS